MGRRQVPAPSHFLGPSQAGITTTLNSRCSVLAAANSVFGRWDETKGEDNIDFMPTILSRFDMIFIVKDEHNEERDLVRGAQGQAGLGVPLGLSLASLSRAVNMGPGTRTNPR